LACDARKFVADYFGCRQANTKTALGKEKSVEIAGVILAYRIIESVPDHIAS
jgi:hypothetical protein